jgi:hypothetical protein
LLTLLFDKPRPVEQVLVDLLHGFLEIPEEGCKLLGFNFLNLGFVLEINLFRRRIISAEPQLVTQKLRITGTGIAPFHHV